MREVTHEQVNLMLRLYDIRREPRLREACDWFIREFTPASGEDVQKLAPPNSQENAFMRMVLGYWDMVANIVNRGLIEEEFFSKTPTSNGSLGNERSPRFSHGARPPQSHALRVARRTL